MAILGHNQIAVTMKLYTHVTTEDQRAAVGLVRGLLDRHPGRGRGNPYPSQPPRHRKKEATVTFGSPRRHSASDTPTNVGRE